jgi:hypothetical protein
MTIATTVTIAIAAVVAHTADLVSAVVLVPAPTSPGVLLVVILRIGASLVRAIVTIVNTIVNTIVITSCCLDHFAAMA